MTNGFYDHCEKHEAPIVTTSDHLYDQCCRARLKAPIVFVPSNNGHTAIELLEAISKLDRARKRLPSGTYTIQEINHLLA
jgi:hypothetical protein